MLSQIVMFTLLATAPESHTASRPSEVPAPRIDLAEDTVSVPMNLETGRIIVDVRINGRGPFPFILDTGAHGGVFDLALAQELKLPLGAASRVGSPGGKGLDARLATVERLEIGGLTVHELSGAAMEGLPFPPGQGSPRGVLSPYRLGDLLVTLDYPHSRLVFRRGSLPQPDEHSVFGWDPNALPLVPIDVAGHKAQVHLDSGSEGGLSLPTSFEKTLPLSTPLTEIGRVRTVDREVAIHGARLAGTVTLGSYKLENPNVTFVDMLADTGNLGPAVLKQFAITIDSGHSRLRLDGPVDGVLRSEERPRRYGIRFASVDASPLEVLGVDPGSPADKGGLHKGDRIVGMNGQPLDKLAAGDRIQALRASPLHLEVLRESAKMAIDLSLD